MKSLFSMMAGSAAMVNVSRKRFDDGGPGGKDVDAGAEVVYTLETLA